MNPSQKKAIKIIQQIGGIIHTAEAINRGINSKTLYELRDKGVLTQISRGVFQVPELDISNLDFVTVISRVPRGVICLISALSFHNLTTQIPHKVDIAIARNARIPRIDWPPIAAYRFSPEAFNAGIELHKIDGVTVQIYCAEKTLVDCFKYRNKIGMDVVLEALKFYKKRKKFNANDLDKYAKICRVGKIMRPYLELLI
jgi:predicted transcriptional regulator of viral defense system